MELYFDKQTELTAWIEDALPGEVRLVLRHWDQPSALMADRGKPAQASRFAAYWAKMQELLDEGVLVSRPQRHVGYWIAGRGRKPGQFLPKGTDQAGLPGVWRLYEHYVALAKV